MKKSKLFLLSLIMLLVTQLAGSQTFTMSKDCRQKIQLGDRMNSDKQYDSAIAVFDAITKQCNSKDGKEAVAIGKAHAYNGKKQYTEAMAAANAALAVSKNTSLNGFFERGIANEGLKNSEAAKADFNQIIALTEKNQNVKERATIYAKIADMNYQSGKMTEGDSNLAKAMELDPANTNFPIQKGDMYVRQGKYDEAFENYDIAVDGGRTDLDMYVIRTNARMKMVQDKYGTSVAQELRAKMTAKEKEQVCVEMKKALELGLKDMKQEMFSALVCK
jgi:tetratricopeptide (TPR) repeat protein